MLTIFTSQVNLLFIKLLFLSKPDIYELYLYNEQKTNIQKHSYASIPDIQTSKWVKELVDTKEECIVGKCKHSFHRSCAKTWIQEQKKCPFCNVKWNYQMISPKDNNGKKSSRNNNNNNDKNDKKKEEAINFDNYEFQQLLNEVDDVVWKALNKNFSLIGLVLKNVLPKKVRIAIGQTDDACNLLINHMRNVSSDNLKKRSSDGLKLDNNTKKHKKDKD